MQLRQLDPSLKDDFQIKFPDLFTSLSQKIFDIQLLDRMSRDFGWNYQKVLIAQVHLKCFETNCIQISEIIQNFHRLRQY